MNEGDIVTGPDQYGDPTTGIMIGGGSDYVMVRVQPYQDITGQWVKPDRIAIMRRDRAAVVELEDDRLQRRAKERLFRLAERAGDSNAPQGKNGERERD